MILIFLIIVIWEGELADWCPIILERFFNFEEPPAAEKVVVDIPFFEQNPIQDEVLINLRESDIKDLNNPSIKLINELSTKEKELLARNNINIKGQINLLKELKKYF